MLGAGTLGGVSALTAADMDGDGDMDLVAADEDENNIVIFFGGH